MSDTGEPPAFDDELYAEAEAPAPNAPIDTHSRSQRKAALAKEKRVIEERQELMQAMLSTSAGRAFLAWVIYDLCGLAKSTFLGPGHTHTFSDFRAGQRDVALHLHQMLLRADKSAYVVLLSEHVDQI